MSRLISGCGSCPVASTPLSAKKVLKKPSDNSDQKGLMPSDNADIKSENYKLPSFTDRCSSYITRSNVVAGVFTIGPSVGCFLLFLSILPVSWAIGLGCVITFVFLVVLYNVVEKDIGRKEIPSNTNGKSLSFGTDLNNRVIPDTNTKGDKSDLRKKMLCFDKDIDKRSEVDSSKSEPQRRSPSDVQAEWSSARLNDESSLSDQYDTIDKIETIIKARGKANVVFSTALIKGNESNIKAQNRNRLVYGEASELSYDHKHRLVGAKVAYTGENGIEEVREIRIEDLSLVDDIGEGYAELQLKTGDKVEFYNKIYKNSRENVSEESDDSSLREGRFITGTVDSVDSSKARVTPLEGGDPIEMPIDDLMLV